MACEVNRHGEVALDSIKPVFQIIRYSAQQKVRTGHRTSEGTAAERQLEVAIKNRIFRRLGSHCDSVFSFGYASVI
jgi:hypothetical protein